MVSMCRFCYRVVNQIVGYSTPQGTEYLLPTDVAACTVRAGHRDSAGADSAARHLEKNPGTRALAIEAVAR